MAKVQAEVKEMNTNPQNLLLECLHSAGYAGALGNPLLAPEMNVNSLNSDLLYDFVQVCAPALTQPLEESVRV